MYLKPFISLFLSCAALGAAAQQARPMSVAQLFERLDAANSELRAGATAAEAARQGVSVAKDGRLPNVDVTASVSYIGNALLTDRDLTNAHGLSSPHLGNSFALEAEQVVYSGGALSAAIRMAELGAEQAAVGLTQTRQRLRFTTIAQYLDLQKLAHRQQVVERNIALTDQLLAHIREREAQGVALRNDITRYELQRQKLALALTKLQNSRRIVNRRLTTALGLAATDSIVPTDHVADDLYAREGEAVWQQQAATDNPALQLAALGEQMARQQQRLVHADRLPKVALVAANKFNGPIDFELPPVDKNINFWYVGVGVRYSLSSLFKGARRDREARLHTRQAQERLQVAHEQIADGVQEAHTDYLQRYVELDTSVKNVRLARENYDVIGSRYDNQLVLITDMIDAANTRLDAELQEADARIAVAYGYYKLMYVSGKL